VNDKLVLKATAGTGFKAPGFQQLYLSFTNPSAGYTVLGASVFEQEVARMRAAGEIRELYPVANLVGDLKAERSLSFNGGFMLTPWPALTVEVNAFHNTIRNMIFEELVGMKQNGSQLYSYRNIEQAFTRGLETNVRWRLMDGLELSAGHQLLYAKDQGVVDEIKTGQKTVRTAEGRSRPAKPADYFNLSNRSRHMANVKLFYEYRPLGISASVRATYRGKYGIGDRNYPNNFIDPYDLYAESYFLFYATVEKRFFDRRLGVQLICDNLSDYNNGLIPNLPGRQFITALSWRFECSPPSTVHRPQ
jgi:outer membrane receptor for ferrienterochelin and colicins